jgi:hypothetical protein
MEEGGQPELDAGILYSEDNFKHVLTLLGLWCRTATKYSLKDNSTL